MSKTAIENSVIIGRNILNEEKTQFLPDNCPFCGSTSYTIDQKTGQSRHDKNGERYTNITVSIRCNKCHARGPTVSFKCKSFKHDAIEQCKNEAYEKWCKRI